jgi:hypothetical protein
VTLANPSPLFASADSLASWIAAISQPARLNLVAPLHFPRGSLGASCFETYHPISRCLSQWMVRYGGCDKFSKSQLIRVIIQETSESVHLSSVVIYPGSPVRLSIRIRVGLRAASILNTSPLRPPSRHEFTSVLG